MLKVKRVYEKPSAADGERFLVDRLWPRGLKKQDAHLKAWLRDLAPSAGDHGKTSGVMSRNWKILKKLHKLRIFSNGSGKGPQPWFLRLKMKRKITPWF